MKTQIDTKLDNPVWNSLSEVHNSLGIDYEGIKFYHPDYCPFGGFEVANKSTQGINTYSQLTDSFFVVGNKPSISEELKINKDLVCLQMIIHEHIHLEYSEQIVQLKAEHFDALFELVNLVQPGYFKLKTSLMGDYFGIFKDNKLIAVTGERMKMNDYTEISAVVTHPDFVGKGFAKQLVAHCVNNILNQNKTPYLHVVESNISAIKLYEKLGFTIRRKISFWHIIK